jgi:2,3,4,5-tetrahydropyridine-2-carboxylate N-succinyltransferase
MAHQQLAAEIEAAFEARDTVTTATTGRVRDAVNEALELLDNGGARVAEKAADGNWVVNQWLKKAVLLSFRLNANTAIPGGPEGSTFWDKVPTKFAGWSPERFRDSGFRVVPGAIVRHSAFIDKGVVLMPALVKTRWSIPGRLWAAAPRSARTCTFRVALALAGFSSRCRPAR